MFHGYKREVRHKRPRRGRGRRKLTRKTLTSTVVQVHKVALVSRKFPPLTRGGEKKEAMNVEKIEGPSVKYTIVEGAKGSLNMI
jgi:hypothetical protein